MSISHQNLSIEKGLKGFIQNWRSDLIAAISVSMVALPLGLAVAAASGVPPISGVLAAIVGGLVTTFIRSAHIAINGPTASLIGVILIAMNEFKKGGDEHAFHYVMAAVVVAGGIQVLLGFFKLGRFADLFPAAVINGILAAIGIMIIASQIHVAIDTKTLLPDSTGPIEKFTYFFKLIGKANLPIAIITIIGLLLLVFHSKISYKFFHLLPAPIWVLIVSVPMYMLFRDSLGEYFGGDQNFKASHLISVPADLKNEIISNFPYPKFDKIGTLLFWQTVISISLIASIETLAAAKAIDKLDPFHRKTNLNKDLMGVGFSTMVSGLVGGLPIISVIVRTTVNIHNNARTKWSNFFHGALLILFIVALADVLQLVPLAALAAILIFMGFKLASPRIFKESYEQGLEQLLFLIGTLLITLFSNLILGIIGGIIIKLLTQILLAHVPIHTFFSMLFKSGTKLLKKSETSYELRMKGIANFLTILNLKTIMQEIPAGCDVKINASNTRILDLSVQEYLYNFKKEQERTGGKVRITGIEQHITSSKHKLAMKTKLGQLPIKLSPRQQRIKKLATTNDWVYRQDVEWDTSRLQEFAFFDTRPIEYKENAISGTFPDCHNENWEISDITFDEGALSAKEVFHTTVEVIHLNKEIPIFVLEQEGFFDKIFQPFMVFRGQKDIDFPAYPEFSKRFLVKGKSNTELQEFFTKELITFLVSKDVYHIESNGNSLLLFRSLKVARTEDIEQMISFSEDLVKVIG
jgi:MFS superfamily sulfate permease-like transporter